MPNLNYPAFDWAAEQLRAQRYAVVSPRELAGPSTNLEWKDYMRQDIRWLADCDEIAMLPGWEQSRGARAELSIALALGMPVLDIETMSYVDTERKMAWLQKLTEVFYSAPN